jgi:hypothetical protein
VQLPLHFHTFPTTPPRARQEAPQVRRAAMFTGVSAFQMGLIHIIAGMMGAGVFERYPRLRVSSRPRVRQDRYAAPGRARPRAFAKRASGPRGSTGNPIIAITQLPHSHRIISKQGGDGLGLAESG